MPDREDTALQHSCVLVNKPTNYYQKPTITIIYN